MTVYTLPELPYEITDLEPILTSEALELHHDKHHLAYVEGANAALDNMADARKSGDYSSLNQLQKNLAFHLSGHVMHSIFWRIMSPQSSKPQGILLNEINKAFRDVDSMREQMSQCALSIQGSGWASLAWEPISQQLVIEQVHDHQGNIGNGTIPIMVLDMWEHAYYLQYRNVKSKWVKNFWSLVNWVDVEHRLRGASKVNLMLSES